MVERDYIEPDISIGVILFVPATLRQSISEQNIMQVQLQS